MCRYNLSHSRRSVVCDLTPMGLYMVRPGDESRDLMRALRGRRPLAREMMSPELPEPEELGPRHGAPAR